MGYRMKKRLDIGEDVVLNLRERIKTLEDRQIKFARDMENGDEAITLLCAIYDVVNLAEYVDRAIHLRIEKVLTNVGHIRI